MQDFVKPVRKRISISDGFAELLNKEIFKDLAEDECICPQCHGVGMVIRNNPYGLENDPDKQAGHFPYQHQSIVPCPNCYNGVVKYCPDCGKQLPRGHLKCSCEAEWRRQKVAEQQKLADELKQAEKHEPRALGFEFMMAFSEAYPLNDGYFSDWDEFFLAWHDNHEATDEKPIYVWGTDPIDMCLDAGSIVEEACEDMYDDAISNIGDKAINEMQDYLNIWKYRYGITAYSETHKHAIRIPWDEDTE